MFSTACQLASQFTRPLVVSTRSYNGRVDAAIGAYIVVNSDGWVVTAAHAFGALVKYNEDFKSIQAYNALIEEADAKQLTGKDRRKLLVTAKPDPDWITHQSYWVGKDGLTFTDITLLAGDFAIARLVGDWDRPSCYPTFKSPESLLPGTSLCKLGFPLIDVPCGFDETANSFSLSFPQNLAFFPLEGIFSRDVLSNDPVTGNVERYIETSSPGLKGQSGGPIYDRNGVVWGIQVRTQHYPLGFDTSLAVDAKTKVGAQFLNVGWGVHPHTIVEGLRTRGVAFEVG